MPWLAALAAPAQAALDPAVVQGLAADDSDAKVAAIGRIVASGDPRALVVLQALGDDAAYTVEGGKRVAIEVGGALQDAVTGAAIDPVPADKDSIVINNRIRGVLSGALAALKLGSTDRAVRLAAARDLQGADSEELLPTIERALAAETDAEIRSKLLVAQATIAVGSQDPAVRLRAVQAMALTDNPQVRQMLASMTTKQKDGSYAEADERVRAAAVAALGEINGRLRKYELLAGLFSGVSLGSVLLLAALGLAITYGLMGIINMAHGEFLMIGAYTTFVVQNLFRSLAPGWFGGYVLAAIPAAFLVSAIVGMLLERGVLRWLYGRPLETLLTTWGVSLLLIQACRSLFGPQNVEVENPGWMSGGIELAGGAVIPYNRIIIIGFAAIVVLLVWLLLTRTRMGLFVRGVTQNRSMASCTGVATHRIDMLTFGLGSGVAGLGGVALSQLGNVGPDLGQGYIVDSFMVVVLGGVGQLAGTIIAALGLGSVAKFLEPFSGAVLAKIFVLVAIILFIQKRPQGLFALKGRSAEA
ncbi:MAG TPA: urea ABC transporter permease subunit UrtB [Burkholderiaceae bacterium]|nr:urea ABC transporter permease subunit UrtB [Burkholderiaceae bacterium]